MSNENFVKSCRNSWVTAQVPDEFIYCMLQVLESGEWYAESRLSIAACEKYSERLGYDFTIIYSAPHTSNAIKWLLKHDVIRSRTKTEYTSMLDKRKTSWKIYADLVEAEKWRAMFEEFGQFPIVRKMNYKKEAQIRQAAIEGALSDLANGNVDNAIETLTYGNVCGSMQNPLLPFGVLEASNE